MDFLSLKKLLEVADENKEYFEQSGLNFKDDKEVDTFLSFINFLIENVEESNRLSSNSEDFIIGYTIPQIGKEFDLLRLGENYNINIEYKSSATVDTMKKQLKRNKYYLKFLSVPTIYFSYCMESKIFIKGIVNESDDLVFNECDPSHFVAYLDSQQYKEVNLSNYHEYFNIKNYLVSPFNDTERFIEDSYLLTSHQENIKKSILYFDYKQFLIEGRPGTGKSLLMYDIAKEVIHREGKESVLIIHTGKLNEGHQKLKREGFNIIPIKDYKNNGISEDVRYVFIDESQRLKKHQLNTLNELSPYAIFFADEEQTLHKKEVAEKICNTLKDSMDIGQKFKLKSKIRSNYELAQFILKLHTLPLKLLENERIENTNKSIMVKYFEDYEAVKLFIPTIHESNYNILGYTTSLYYKDPFDEVPRGEYVSHDVIGQEFDNVAVIMDNNFKYDLRGKNYRLIGTGKSYYDSTKMLYQNLTRVRKNLIIMVVGNEDLFVKISSIVNRI